MSDKEQQGIIKIELDLARYFEGSVLDRIEEELTQKLSNSINKQIATAVEKKILDLCDAQFNTLAKAEVEAFFSKSLYKTNSYGERNGEPVSMRELLLDKFTKYLDENVDPKSGTPSTYHGDKTIKRSQFMLNQMAHAPLQQAIDESVKGLTAKAKEQIQASVSRYIADQLAPTISVPKLNQ